jgi:hypothetical protein
MINKPGASMEKADALPRRPDHKEGVENNNDKVTLLKLEFFAIQALQQGHVLIEGAEVHILSKIRRTKDLDESVVKAVEEMKRSPTKRLRSEEWAEEQDLTLFRGKVCVPRRKQL